MLELLQEKPILASDDPYDFRAKTDRSRTPVNKRKEDEVNISGPSHQEDVA